MLRFSQRSKAKISPIRAIFARIPEEIAKWKNKGGFKNASIGQPHIAPNPEVISLLEHDAANNAADKLGYTASAGEPETLDAIVRLYQQYYPKVQYSTSEVMVTTGASGALSNVFSALVEGPQDIILTPEPFFGAYIPQINEWEGSLKMIPTQTNGFRPTPEGLRKALKENPGTRAIILNYPNNPSGVSLTREEVEGLVAVLREFPDVWVITDDVYRDFNHRKHVSVLDVAPDFKDRTIVINSGAKGLVGAPGYRIGMIAAHEQLIKAMLPRQINTPTSVPHATQRALVHAVNVYLDNPNNEWLTNAQAEYRSNLTVASEAFKSQGFKIAVEPEGTFYLLIDASHMIGDVLKNDVDIANYLIEKAGVALVPGSGFGIDPNLGYLRVSCANSKELLVDISQRMGAAAVSLKSEENVKRLSGLNL